ncbi:hypothetical protein L2E82_39866 [Cichorium intybus]|uniref:Uncharacterized protein n=1 Tax=Cichorium intybus TaxID=13427 RepID=A0ACB9AIR5_CICIN|nr:hypothetical protein L2E82_39866 [Cichorium intybus]
MGNVSDMEEGCCEACSEPSSMVPLKSGMEPPPFHDPLSLNAISNDGMLMILDLVSPSIAPSGSFFSSLIGTLVAELHTAVSTKENPPVTILWFWNLDPNFNFL